jgi:hypothetical protein
MSDVVLKATKSPSATTYIFNIQLENLETDATVLVINANGIVVCTKRITSLN